MSDISFRQLEASDIEVRVSQCSDKGVSLLLYKDARCDMRLLDDAVGADRWQCSYEQIGANLYCTVTIKSDDGEWVSKQDVGTPSNMEGEKGCASDAFKRACFKWGIGRELYTAPFIWVKKGDCDIGKNAKGKPTCYDRFSVSSLVVEDGHIKSVEIKNEKTGKIVFSNTPTKPVFNAEGYIKRINELILEAVNVGIKEEGLNDYISATYNTDRDHLESLTKEQLTDIGKHITTIIADKKALNDGLVE